MFYEQFKILCNNNNTNPTKFTKEILNLSTSKVTAWKNGAIPKYEVLQSIADYFNVTVGFLFDGFNNSNQNIQAKSIINSCNQDEQRKRLLDNYDKMNNEGKAQLVGLSEIISGNPKYLKADSENNKIVS